MKILMMLAYYEPEIAASLYLTINVIEALTSSGIEIELYTPSPTRGIDENVRKEYKHKHLEVEFGGKLKVHRFKMFRESNKPIFRAFRYLLINIVQLFKGLSAKNINLIFVGSTPPTMGFIGSIIKYFKKIPLVYCLQDIFPDSMVNTSMISRKSKLIRFGHLVENYTYRNSDKIIVISDDFKQNLLAKGVPEDKIIIIYNWVDENEVVSIRRVHNILFKKYSLDRSKFYLTYCGNIGLTQNMDMLLNVAKALSAYKDIEFILIGDGAYKHEFDKKIILEGITNLRILPFQPYKDISYVFSLGDIGLVISKANIGQNSIPSKTWSIMSAERTVLASFDTNSELNSIIKKANCGICIQAEDKEGLLNAILDLYKMRENLEVTGQNGRKYILEHFSRKKGTALYVEAIKSVLNKHQKDV